MGNQMKKPKNYKRGRCAEFECICREERNAGEKSAVAKPCNRDLPCLVNIMVLAGLEPACDACSPYVQRMRDTTGWERLPTSHGEFYTSKSILPDQQELIMHRIGQADLANWINEERNPNAQ